MLILKSVVCTIQQNRIKNWNFQGTHNLTYQAYSGRVLHITKCHKKSDGYLVSIFVITLQLLSSLEHCSSGCSWSDPLSVSHENRRIRQMAIHTAYENSGYATLCQRQSIRTASKLLLLIWAETICTSAKQHIAFDFADRNLIGRIMKQLDRSVIDQLWVMYKQFSMTEESPDCRYDNFLNQTDFIRANNVIDLRLSA